MKKTIFELIRESVLPKHECHYKTSNQTLTQAAVLIGILDSTPIEKDKTEEDELHILLTKRTDHLHHHPGQISLPGGRKDQVDSNPVQTALRETTEETGIASEFIEVIGTLEEYPTVTGFLVTPIVARIKQGYSLAPDPFEVEEIFFVPMQFILDQENHQRHEYTDLNQTDPRSKRTGFYYQIDYRNKRIWGVTAGILISFYKRLKDNHPLFCEQVPQMAQQGLRNHKK